MPKKRKSDATRLDEVDRGMYTAFCGAANSLSQLYSQAMHQQRLSFQIGERHAMEKLYNWILRQQEDGVRVMPADIIAYIQNELDIAESPPSQTGPHSTYSGTQVSSNAFGSATIGQEPRSGNSDQTKNSGFSNALASPVRRSLQNYHLSPGGNYTRSSESNCNQIRDPNPQSSNDTSMDMHADSPGHDSPY
ncbi:hypothetical protein CDL12_00376 [Handroanthus impetiginosus]|uniref:Holocarboxylase synthetase n=1 Tax=Handroanthus impetiginosus TaxID=429701 RepID=A0A2G9IAV8_9LAMI|nr:hypothetical protein CDL12_00376 [Handroanthus impetiginosus]